MLTSTQQELSRLARRPSELQVIVLTLDRVLGGDEPTPTPTGRGESGATGLPVGTGGSRADPSKKAPSNGKTSSGRAKTCSKCKLPKPIERFPPHPNTADGLAAWCKDCRAVLRKRRNQTNMGARLKHHFAARMTQQLKDNGIEEVPPLVLEMESYLGYKMGDLVRYLDADVREREGMSLKEAFDEGYHVDHITPLSKFPFGEIGDEGFRECWAMGNLRAIPAADNLKKGSEDIFGNGDTK